MAAPATSSSTGPAGLALRAIVKSVHSGDTLNLQSRNSTQQRSIHLAHLQAPRTGSKDRNDEAYAIQARDFLRTMVVGREISFEITYTIPASGATGQMEFGDVVLQRPGTTESVDVALAVVEAGCAKVRESRSNEQEGSSEAARKATLREAEERAKEVKKGLWADDVPHSTVNYNMPDDADAFLGEHGQGKKLDACVEAVNNGSTVRVRLQTGQDTYQIVNLAYVASHLTPDLS